MLSFLCVFTFVWSEGPFFNLESVESPLVSKAILAKFLRVNVCKAKRRGKNGGTRNARDMQFIIRFHIFNRVLCEAKSVPRPTPAHWFSDASGWFCCDLVVGFAWGCCHVQNYIAKYDLTCVYAYVYIYTYIYIYIYVVYCFFPIWR